MLVLQANSVCAVIKNQIADLKLLGWSSGDRRCSAGRASSSAIPKGFTK